MLLKFVTSFLLLMVLLKFFWLIFFDVFLCVLDLGRCAGAIWSTRLR
jgi:hypothetical protein